jgi:hypothetical protein
VRPWWRRGRVCLALVGTETGSVHVMEWLWFRSPAEAQAWIDTREAHGAPNPITYWTVVPLP